MTQDEFNNPPKAPTGCLYCGPHCYGGAEHNERVENDDRFDDTPQIKAARTARRINKYGI